MAIRDGQIAALGDLASLAAKISIHADSRLVLPAFIDVCPPTPHPDPAYAISCGFAPCVSTNDETIPPDSPQTRIKPYLAPEHTPFSPPLSAQQMLSLMQEAAKTRIRTRFLCYNASILAHERTKAEDAGLTQPLDYLAACPRIAAIESLTSVLALAAETQAPVHLHHLSLKQEVELLRAYKTRHHNVTADVALPHLLFCADDFDSYGSLLKTFPPVREHQHRASLWQGLKDGTIDMVTPMHRAVLPENKLSHSIWQAEDGFPTYEVFAPLLLAAYEEEGLSLNDFVRHTSEAPARAFGLWPRQGMIQIGAQADLLLLDTRKSHEFLDAGMRCPTGLSPFDGMVCRSKLTHVLAAGEIMVIDQPPAVAAEEMETAS